jgi:hypothetical protein
MPKEQIMQHASISVEMETKYTAIISGKTYPLPECPTYGYGYNPSIFAAPLGEKGIRLGYLVPDEFPENPLEACDGYGNIYHHKDFRYGSREEHETYCEVLGLDQYGDSLPGKEGKPSPYAVLLDVHEHGQVYYKIASTSGDYWDTSRGVAVWYPDDCLIPEIKSYARKHRVSYHEAAEFYAKQALELYNAWANGDCWGIVIANYDEDGNLIDSNSIWGYYGYEDAVTCLKSALGIAPDTTTRGEDHVINQP